MRPVGSPDLSEFSTGIAVAAVVRRKRSNAAFILRVPMMRTKHQNTRTTKQSLDLELFGNTACVSVVVQMKSPNYMHAAPLIVLSNAVARHVRYIMVRQSKSAFAKATTFRVLLTIFFCVPFDPAEYY